MAIINKITPNKKGVIYLIKRITMDIYQIILTIFFVVMTIVGLIVMKVDKEKAKRNAWRIKEGTLFTVAALFGGIGTTSGMFLFCHKTNHWYFVVFMPLLAVVNIVLFVFLYGII